MLERRFGRPDICLSTRRMHFNKILADLFEGSVYRPRAAVRGLAERDKRSPSDTSERQIFCPSRKALGELIYFGDFLLYFSLTVT